MNRSWAANAMGTPPPTPSSFSTGYPTDGDPASNQPPTYPGAWWYYMVTQEIVNAITAAGLTPSATTVNQLASAITALSAVSSVNGRTGAVTGVVDTATFTGANQSLAASGYQKLPGGLILQWGTTAVPSGANVGSQAMTFPIAFPTALYAVAGNADKLANGTWFPVAVMFTGRSVTGATVVADTANGAQNLQAGINVTWWAVGK